jgi:UPF0755 protein
LVAASAAGGWLMLVYPNERAAGAGRTIEITLPTGVSARQVGELLASNAVIGNAQLWAFYARLVGADRKLRAGVIRLQDNLTVSETIRRVTREARDAQVRITIPEGLSRFEIARLFEQQAGVDSARFLEATEEHRLLADLGIDAPNAEGYLFPDTYLFTNREGAPEFVRRLVLTWRRRMTPLLQERATALMQLQNELGWGPFQVLTLASIVEKEAAVASERPIIAGVFLNRLLRPDFLPKRLQADPTVAYGCVALPQKAPSCASYVENHITRAMLDDAANVYNTYRYEGLPPGPIANPGLDAMKAVLNPAKHEYLYFVANGAGRHRFSATIEAHNRAVHTPTR